MSGGGNSGSSTNRPLSGPERKQIFDSGLSGIGTALGFAPKTTPAQGFWQDSPAQGSFNDGQWSEYAPASRKWVETSPAQSDYSGLFPGYNAPSYTASPTAQSLSGGDYDRLEQSITDSRWAPLQRYESQVRQMTDEDLNKRGIWSSGVATQAQGDVTEQFAPQYAAAGAEAATQRYGLQAQEQQFLNTLAAQEAARKTGFDAALADQEYASKWAPLEYLMGLFNQTGGTIGSSRSSGFSFGL